MRLAWLTDIHLNFVGLADIDALARQVRDARPDAVLIGGDIGEAHDLTYYLEVLAELLQVPVYFVLGNHDYYRGSIAAVRAEVVKLTERMHNLVWLSAVGVVPLTERTALVGHDGWGDGGFGNALTTPVLLNDFVLIDEFRNLERVDLLAVLRRLGDEAAAHFRNVLPAALRDHDRAIVLTHVPPFREAAWHDGRASDDDWLPFFACKAAGDAIRDVMAENLQCQATVLCGHTHGAGEFQPAPNIVVLTGGAEYRRPQLQGILEVE